MDERALAALADEPLDWRFKSFPPTMATWTVADLLARRPALFDAGFTSPVCVLHADAVQHNLERLARFCRDHAVAVAPHGKTTMAPQLFARQLAHGAWGITAATAWQVRVFRAFGVPRILLANELVDPAGLAWVAAELALDKGFAFVCYVDSVAGVERMDAVLREAALDRPIDVLVELGHTGGRTGCRSAGEAEAVARAVSACERLRLVGVAGYEGTIGHDATSEVLATVRAFLERVRALAWRLLDAGAIAADVDPVLVSAGGSAFFAEVVDVFSGGWPRDRTVLPLLRSGGYATHDEGLYAQSSPFTRCGGDPLRPALELWSRVLSRPEPRLAVLDAGKRDVSFDVGLPLVRKVRRDGGQVAALDGPTIVDLNDQHAYVRVDPELSLSPSDWVGLGIVHPCTLFDKWRLLPVIDAEYRVVDAVRTFF